MPLALSAVLALGAVANVIPSSRSKSLGAKWSLADLSMLSTTEAGYLDKPGATHGSVGPLQTVTLVHNADHARGRAVYLLLLPYANAGTAAGNGDTAQDGAANAGGGAAGLPTARGVVVVVQGVARGAKEVSTAAAERLWREAREGVSR